MSSALIQYHMVYSSLFLCFSVSFQSPQGDTRPPPSATYSFICSIPECSCGVCYFENKTLTCPACFVSNVFLACSLKRKEWVSWCPWSWGRMGQGRDSTSWRSRDWIEMDCQSMRIATRQKSLPHTDSAQLPPLPSHLSRPAFHKQTPIIWARRMGLWTPCVGLWPYKASRHTRHRLDPVSILPMNQGTRARNISVVTKPQAGNQNAVGESLWIDKRVQILHLQPADYWLMLNFLADRM